MKERREWIGIVIAILIVTLPLSIQAVSLDAEIKTLLTEVKKSQGDARRKAMNRLKLKLRSASTQTRAQTMHQLRKTFGHSTSSQRGEQHVGGMQQQQTQMMQQMPQSNQGHQCSKPMCPQKPHPPQKPAHPPSAGKNPAHPSAPSQEAPHPKPTNPGSAKLPQAPHHSAGSMHL